MPVSCILRVQRRGTTSTRPRISCDVGIRPLASKVLVEFPRVNLVSILAGALALISVFLPWWGLTGSAFGLTASVTWSLWNSPFLGDTSVPANAQAAQQMGQVNVLVLGIVFIAVAIAFLGSFAPKKEYLIVGCVSSITALIVYTAGVSYTLGKTCQGASWCPSGPVGSTIVNGAAISWGFETGFYLLLVSSIMMVFAVIFHKSFLQWRRGTQSPTPVLSQESKFCSNCGHPLQVDAKFCSHCARPVSS